MKKNNFDKSKLPKPISYYQHEANIKLAGKGEWVRGLCPFHNDTNPSLSVYTKNGAFICHACGAKGGSIIAFEMKLKNCSYAQACKNLGLEKKDNKNNKKATKKMKNKASVSQTTLLDNIEEVEAFAEKSFYNKNGFELDMLHPYKDQFGNVICYVIRFTNFETGDKKTLPLSCNNGKLVFKQPVWQEVYQANGKRAMYNLYDLYKHADEVVYIVEGEKDADNLRQLGFVVVTSMGGASNAKSTDWQPLFGRQVIIWRDNDDSGQKYQDTIITELQKIQCKSISVVNVDELDLPNKGDASDYIERLKTDNNKITDIEITENINKLPKDFIELQAVRSDISEAKTNHAEHIAEPFHYGAGTFYTKQDGVYYVVEGEMGNDEIFICSNFKIVAQTRDKDSHSWGLFVEWLDPDGKKHSQSIPMSELQGDAIELRKNLADRGLNISNNRKARTLFQTYISSYPVDKKAICVKKLGWHDDAFVLGDDIYGEHDDMIVFQLMSTQKPSLSSQGSLEQWQQQVSQHAIGQKNIIFAIASAFSGTLLEPLNAQGGGFHYYGTTSTGKSTALIASASVWGKPKSYVKTWNHTSNSLEGVACNHNHMPLILDELGECDIKTLSKTIYMLSNGCGKGRMKRDTSIKESKSWLLSFLSAGEVTAKQMLNETGKSIKGGQEVRMVQIDVSGELGIFDKLSFGENGAEQSDILKQACDDCYGVAGEQWLQKLTADKAKAMSDAKTYHEDFIKSLPTKTNKEASRVAKRFAVVAAAGELATQYGITGWEKGVAHHACLELFKGWVEVYGSGNIEHRHILNKFKAFIEAHGGSRFQAISNNEATIYNRAGYYEDINNETYYYFTDSCFEEVCLPYNKREAIKALHAAGWLRINQNDCKKYKLSKVKAADCNVNRMYTIKKSALFKQEASNVEPLKQDACNEPYSFGSRNNLVKKNKIKFKAS